MKPFLRQVAEQILHENPGRTEQVLVVFNNHRSELFLRQHFKAISAETGETFFMPQTMVIDDLVRQMSGLEIVQPEFLLFELYRIHCEMEGEERKYKTFEEFIPFGDMMLNDFSEVDRYMVDANDLFVNLHNLKEIGEWDITDPHMSEFQSNYLRFYHSLYEYYNRLRKHLAGRGQAYSGMAYRTVAERLKNDQPTTVNHQLSTYFVGFNAMSECERTIIGSFVHSGRGHLVTDGDAYYYNDETQEAGYFLRKHSAEFSELGQYGPSLFATGKKQVTIVECPENVLQCKYAGQLLSKHQDWLKDAESTAIVLADESLLIPTLASLPNGEYNVNVTMGFAYTDSHLHMLAEKVLELHRRRNARGYYHADVLEVICDHFIAQLCGQEKSARATVAQMLTKNNMVRVTESLIAENFPEATFLFPKEELTPEGCIALLREMASRILSAGLLETNPKERQAAGALAEVTEHLTCLHRDYGFMKSIESLETIYNRISKRHSISFIGQPLSGLQVLGMLETRNLDFKRVILLSAGEGVLPVSRSTATLIPHELKRAFNLPTYEERDSVYAYNFYRLLQRAEEVFLIYSSDAESAGKGEESRLLKQVRSELARRYPNNIEVKDIVLDTNTNKLNLTMENKDAEVSVPKTTEIMQHLNYITTNYGFSPTALSRYLECPLKHYYVSILGLREQETLEDNIDASQFGETVHNVLRDIYKPYVGRKVEAAALKEARTNLEQLLDNEMARLMSGGRSNEGRNSFLRSVALSQLDKMLARETKLIEEDHSLEIVALEQDYRYNNITGRVDRIDRYDGHLRIIDYKTGNFKPSEIAYTADKTIPAKWLQLMCYALMFARCSELSWENKLYVGIYPLRYLKSGVQLASWNGQEKVNPAMIDDFETTINDIIATLLNQDVPFSPTPSDDACRYCPATAFCPALKNRNNWIPNK